jgi:hypothetical protein
MSPYSKSIISAGGWLATIILSAILTGELNEQELYLAVTGLLTTLGVFGISNSPG